MACGVHAREIEKSTITPVLNECLRDFPHIGALRKEQKTCLVNLARGKDVLQSCQPSSVLPDHQKAITEQSQEEVFNTGGTTCSSIYIIFRKQAGA